MSGDRLAGNARRRNRGYHTPMGAHTPILLQKERANGVMCFPYSLEKKLPKPKSTQEIGYAELANILRQRFPDEGEIYLSDRKYKLCNIEDIRVFCRLDTSNQEKYVSEWYDCDDFAYRLMGQLSIPDWSSLAFGIVWTDKHAMNVFVDEGKTVLFLEPQSDAIETQLADWQGTHLRFVMM